MNSNTQRTPLGDWLKLVIAIVLLVIATLLSALGLRWALDPQPESPFTHEGGYVTGVIAIVLALMSVWALATVDSRTLNTTLVFAGLALGLFPYVLLIGSPGYAFNAGFLLLALGNALALWRAPGREAQ